MTQLFGSTGVGRLERRLVEHLEGQSGIICKPSSCSSFGRDSDLSTIISNLHHTRQHGMPEGQSASDHNTSTGHRDDLLGKRRSFSPNSSSECPSDSKKSRSVSPK
ncbi:sterile alpha motif domain-containing protein 11 isoform X1, partial [Lates japonicus]